MKKVHFSPLVFFLFLGSLVVGSTTSAQDALKQRHLDNSGEDTKELYETPAETPFNTASFTAADGKTYKLTVIGDMLPKLFINGKKVSKNELPVYQDHIDRLNQIISDRQKKESDRVNAISERIKNQILTDIVDKKLSAKKDVRSYYLTSKVLMINSKIQDPVTFHFFRSKYIKSDDTVFYYEARDNDGITSTK